MKGWMVLRPNGGCSKQNKLMFRSLLEVAVCGVCPSHRPVSRGRFTSNLASIGWKVTPPGKAIGGEGKATPPKDGLCRILPAERN
uniref:Uncharacterized protein n=1 Tax=Globodera rostochiensis TaxID=31243 RepID=A0A914H2E7_GLORO